MEHHPVVIIGAGSAGLTAAYELIKAGIKPIVLESRQGWWHSRTETYKGYHFDIRPIRKFYTPYVVLFSALSPDSYAISYVHGKIRLSDAK